MSEENKHMDDAFSKMNDGFKVKYDASFWSEAEAKLNDSNLDDAFRAAAVGVTAPIFDAGQSVDDVFMDASFVDASINQSATYNSEYFEAFKATESNLEMDDAFQNAASSVVVDYSPNFWSDADVALQAEGLHHEYDSAYWKEAKQLLDKSDRKVFFAKWSAVAAMLLLFSFSGQFLGLTNFDEQISTPELAEIDNSINESSLNENANLVEATENYTLEIEPNGLASNDVPDLDSQGIDNNLQNTDQFLVSNQINLDSKLNSVNPTSFKLNKSPLISENRNELSVFSVRQESTLNKDVLKLNIPIINLVANSHTIEAPINKGLENPKAMHSISFIVDGGVGNKWGELELSPTYRTSIGIEYNYAPAGVLKNFEFGVNGQLNHSRQNNLGVEKRSSVYELDGGVSKYWYKLQLKDIIFANVNFSAAYKLAPKHKLKFGVGFEHILAVNSNISFRDSHAEEITTVNNNWGIKDGINKMDMRLSLGYGYQLTNRLSLQLTTNFGLFDRTDDDFMQLIQKDHEMSVMLGVKYNLFRKN